MNEYFTWNNQTYQECVEGITHMYVEVGEKLLSVLLLSKFIICIVMARMDDKAIYIATAILILKKRNLWYNRKQ